MPTISCSIWYIVTCTVLIIRILHIKNHHSIFIKRNMCSSYEPPYQNNFLYLDQFVFIRNFQMLWIILKVPFYPYMILIPHSPFVCLDSFNLCLTTTFFTFPHIILLFNSYFLITIFLSVLKKNAAVSKTIVARETVLKVYCTMTWTAGSEPVVRQESSAWRLLLTKAI